ncbi:2-phosphosulfolactate phosphatase [Desulfofundulus thermosubterraneus]|uniref:Probable 2-phosphosulfolactate phosphatase n=1 Tax=Desulfofundulus thermosubterraneus DSM 16057 TaxID=1121432 RepID=A0A1M6MC82_9FIRM|nr:2-phosphosulfolactate phosphatase [Desulfofundulus thermosubterraneus]SHJ81029.1 2-phosphosulfolactate phosphatase [Desulfofundulus thermosubterraneus DSM 16057]
MHIDLLLTAESIVPAELAGRTAVVFDVLRATSTIVTAIAHGCRGVVTVVDTAEAQEVAARLAGENTPALLAGERGGEKIPGFPHGNSPLEYTPEVVGGKVLVLTTSNGSRALNATIEGARTVVVGSLLNARAVAQKACRLGRDVTLVCAGTQGKFSLEDTLAAGMVVLEMVEMMNPGCLCSNHHPSSLDLADLSVAALHLALAYRDNPRRAFDHSHHGRKLFSMGLTADLDWCASLNTFEVVPVVKVVKKENGYPIIEKC